ncbi:chymotrypsin-1-like [Rhopalosiphum padi]|uniref:chymotrypsin-1-like n=1 Tax=Rhopalosiphum padi TaxID=40932 RepID=UPI00298D794B|nr:chymotrypsin-1-like [Rhopalosiphum padi]
MSEKQNVPQNPSSLMEIEIPEIYAITKNGHPFLIFDSVALFEHILTNSLSNGLICSGKRYDAKKYPYVVSISIRPADKAFGYVCTGSLINELYILTAGHCTFGRTINEIKVYQGSALNNTDSRDIVELHLPKEYDPASELPDGDICVLKLKNGFPNLKTFIKIGGEPKDFANHKALKCTFIGFGITDKKNTFGKEGNMIEALVRHGRTECKNHEKKRVVVGWPQFLCSQPTTVDDLRMTCQGDSGGPMICNNKLYGVCSFMYKIGEGKSVCGIPDVQTVHTFIHYFLKWVNSVIKSNGNENQDDKKEDDKKKDDKKEDDKKDDKKEGDKKKKKKKKKKKSSGNSIKPYYKFHRIVYCVDN